ncbi:hypothetical protein Pst134EA_006947 [Puccinia striiformis f. sp. tritici]|uniref:hypothetical protein n=1 Tax=Puccinia striiformis f. sp. tritici TaxID=168172 RepID=UPI00200845B5|nr:hypothetical protein Pst134EA_006947 [Puccinia striiformis f. sp. tritici]KAH9469661.1 hypothetical protein Pst134EA_006947 [Puccinia striiformis f. sp. tritici]
MDNNVPTRDELVAASALLGQKRQAAIEHLEHRKSRRVEPNESTNDETEKGTKPGDDSQRSNNTERNQLDRILGSLGDTQGEPRSTSTTIDRADTEEQRYTGTAAAEEWSQSYAQWSRNYQGFIATLKDVYNFSLFSEWLRTHRDRCNQTMRCEGFCAGFRYDLAVRANAFQCDFVRNETALFPDVSKHREDIVEETLAGAKRYGEVGYINNPYINGGKKENFDPHTGKEKTMYDKEGKSGDRFQPRSTSGRTRSDYQGARGIRDDYNQDTRFRREDNSRGGGFRNRNGDAGYDDRTRDRSKNYKSQHGYRNNQTKRQRRYEPYIMSDHTRGSDDQNTTISWPTEVRCEMNLRVWEDALDRAGLREKYARRRRFPGRL